MAYSVLHFTIKTSAIDLSGLSESEQSRRLSVIRRSQIDHTPIMQAFRSALFTLPFLFLLFRSPAAAAAGSDLSPRFHGTLFSSVLLCFSLFDLLDTVLTPSVFVFVFGGVGAVGRGEFSPATGRNLAEATVGNSSLILAKSRTDRKDPLNNFARYTGGWNITNKHYWAVSFCLIYLCFMSLFFSSLSCSTVCRLHSSSLLHHRRNLVHRLWVMFNVHLPLLLLLSKGALRLFPTGLCSVSHISHPLHHCSNVKSRPISLSFSPGLNF